jgi:hypothetical protein
MILLPPGSYYLHNKKTGNYCLKRYSWGSKTHIFTDPFVEDCDSSRGLAVAQVDLSNSTGQRRGLVLVQMKKWSVQLDPVQPL